MAEISQKQFWLDETNHLAEDIELLSDLVSLPQLDEKIVREATAEIKKVSHKIDDLDAKLGHIGHAHVCYGDYAWARGFNPKIKMVRDKTLMQGHEYCNHRYIFEQ